LSIRVTTMKRLLPPDEPVRAAYHSLGNKFILRKQCTHIKQLKLLFVFTFGYFHLHTRRGDKNINLSPNIILYKSFLLVVVIKGIIVNFYIFSLKEYTHYQIRIDQLLALHIMLPLVGLTVIILFNIKTYVL
jgi:hypothetical protein